MTSRTMVCVTAVAALVVLAGCDDGDRGPSARPATTSPVAPTSSSTPTSLPVGAPPAVPYVVGTRLYLGGKAQPGIHGVAATHGRTTLITIGNSDGGDTARYEVLRDGKAVARFTTRYAVVSRDGSKVAWVAVDRTSAHLVEIDATTGHEIDRTSLDRSLYAHEGEESEAWETLVRVDDDGTVSFGGVAASHTWKPGHAPVDVPLRNDSAPPAGFPWRAGWDAALSPTTDWGAWPTDRNGRTDVHGTNGWVNDGVTLQRRGRPATKETIVLPHGFNAGGLTWESATNLLVHVSDDPDQAHWQYLRCDITTRSCELAPTPPGR
jgi:hypothetical protein